MGGSQREVSWRPPANKNTATAMTKINNAIATKPDLCMRRTTEALDDRQMTPLIFSILDGRYVALNFFQLW